MGNKSMSRKLSRREFLVLSSQSALAAAVLASCAPPATQAPAPAVEKEEAPAPEAKAPAEEAVTIKFTAIGGEDYIPGIEAVVPMFMERNPDIKVDVTYAPYEDYYTKLQTQVAGGASPDVAVFQGWEWQPYADKGLLAPIDALIQRDNFTDPWPDVPTVHATTQRNGQTWHVPFMMGTMVMFYAKQPFDEAGIPYPTDDWTMEEFLDTAEKLTDVSGQTRKFGYQANAAWFRDIHWIRSTGQQEFDTLIDPHKVQFNQPEIVEMVQLIASDVYYKLGISPTPADLEGGANTINTGNSAMKYEGPWFLPLLNSPKLREEGKQVEFDVVLMPQGADATRPHRGWSEGVNLFATDQVEQAWALAKYLADEEGNKVLSEVLGLMPNSVKLVEEFWIPKIKEAFGVSNGQAFLEAFRRAEVDVIGGIPRSQMWNEVVKPVAWDPLTLGSATAADVLPEVDRQLQAVLDEYWAEHS